MGFTGLLGRALACNSAAFSKLEIELFSESAIIKTRLVLDKICKQLSCDPNPVLLLMLASPHEQVT